LGLALKTQQASLSELNSDLATIIFEDKILTRWAEPAAPPTLLSFFVVEPVLGRTCTTNG
jgi:hypothetical protein